MIAAGRRVKVMPQMKVEQGITAARTIFGKCFFEDSGGYDPQAGKEERDREA